MANKCSLNQPSAARERHTLQRDHAGRRLPEPVPVQDNASAAVSALLQLRIVSQLHLEWNGMCRLRLPAGISAVPHGVTDSLSGLYRHQYLHVVRNCLSGYAPNSFLSPPPPLLCGSVSPFFLITVDRVCCTELYPVFEWHSDVCPMRAPISIVASAFDSMCGQLPGNLLRQ